MGPVHVSHNMDDVCGVIAGMSLTFYLGLKLGWGASFPPPTCTSVIHAGPAVCVCWGGEVCPTAGHTMAGGDPGSARGTPPSPKVDSPTPPPRWGRWLAQGWLWEGEFLSPSSQRVSDSHWPVLGGCHPCRLGIRGWGALFPCLPPMLPHKADRYRQDQAEEQRHCSLSSVTAMGQGQPWLS